MHLLVRLKITPIFPVSFNQKVNLMTFTRKNQILNFMIQVNSPVHPVHGVPVVITSCETVHDPSGEQVGHPQQAQSFVIGDDMTPDLLRVLNDALSYLGYELAPIGKK